MGFIFGFAEAPVDESPVQPTAESVETPPDSTDSSTDVLKLAGSKNEPTPSPVAKYSNDNIELMGLMSDEQFVGEGQDEMTFQGPVVGKQEVPEEFEVEDRVEVKEDGPPESSFRPHPCSNDSNDLGAALDCVEINLELDLEGEQAANDTPANDTAGSSKLEQVDEKQDISTSVARASELDQCAELPSNLDQSIAVDFAYDIYTSPDVTDKLGSVLSDFERRLSKGVARFMGVLDCSDTAVVSLQIARTTTDQLKRRMLRRRSLDSRMLTSQDVLAIDAMPLDSILDADCIPPSSDLGEPFECFPVDGAMTVTVGAAGKRYARNLQGSVDDQILAAVKNYIEQGTSEYTNNDVLGVKFLGKREGVDDSSRTTVQPADSVAASTQEEMSAEMRSEIGKNGIGSVGYLGIVLVLISAVLFASLYVQRRRARGRRKSCEQDQSDRVPAEADLEADIEEVFVDLDSSFEGVSQDDAPSSLAVMGGMATGVMQQMSATSAREPPSSDDNASESDSEVDDDTEDAPKADEADAEHVEDKGTMAHGPSPPSSPVMSRDEVANTTSNNIEDAPKADEVGAEHVEDEGTTMAHGLLPPVSPIMSREEVPINAANNIDDTPKVDESGADYAEDKGTMAHGGPPPPVWPVMCRDEVPDSPPSSPHQSLIEADAMDNFDMTPVHLSSSSDVARACRVPSLSKDDTESSFIGDVDLMAADAGIIGDVDDTAEETTPTKRTTVDDTQYV